MKLTPKQEMHLRNVKAANLAWRAVKRDALTRARVIVEREVADHQLAMDREVRLAHEAGVPGTQIYRHGMGTTNAQPFYASLGRTAPSETRASIATDPLAGRYRWNAASEMLTITLAGRDLSDALDELDWDVSEAKAKELGLDGAEFIVRERADGSRYLTTNTVLWMPEYGNSHPVVFWATTHPGIEEEALGWYAEHVA
jgi:hypothetical protein